MSPHESYKTRRTENAIICLIISNELRRKTSSTVVHLLIRQITGNKTTKTLIEVVEDNRHDQAEMNTLYWSAVSRMPCLSTISSAEEILLFIDVSSQTPQVTCKEEEPLAGQKIVRGTVTETK